MDGMRMISRIQELVSIPSPSGYTQNIIRHIQGILGGLQIQTRLNRKGGLMATIPGTETRQHRLLTAHVDTLGAMVKEIKGNGRLKLSLVGGSRWNHIEGEYSQIFTTDGRVYTGTILMHQTAVHVYEDAASAKRDQGNMEVRIDAQVNTAEAVQDLGIGVGDFVAFDPRVQVTPSGFIKSRHLDDKASAGVLICLMEQIAQEKIQLPYTTHFLFSNYEEVGFGGNSAIPPEVVEYLAVDMGAIGDGQTTDEYTVSICALDSSGPYDYRLRQHLVGLAQDNQIQYRVDIYPYYGSDASGALRAGHDIVHGLIGPGIDASHAFERTHVSSLEQTAALIYHYLLSPLA